MAEKEAFLKLGQEPPDVKQIKKRLDLFDQRLDSIDSMLSALVQRVMHQPIVLNITCPKCGSTIEIDLIGEEKLVK